MGVKGGLEPGTSCARNPYSTNALLKQILGKGEILQDLKKKTEEKKMSQSFKKKVLKYVKN